MYLSDWELMFILQNLDNPEPGFEKDLIHLREKIGKELEKRVSFLRYIPETGNISSSW